MSASETATEAVLEGSNKSKLQESVQFQTVLALNDQEKVRNNGQLRNSRLKTAGRLHIDQAIKARNLRVRSKIVEKGVLNKSQNGQIACVGRKVGECYQWKANGQCSRGDSCSFCHEPAFGNEREAQVRKGQLIRRQGQTVNKPGNRGVSSSNKG